MATAEVVEQPCDFNGLRGQVREYRRIEAKRQFRARPAPRSRPAPAQPVLCSFTGEGAVSDRPIIFSAPMVRALLDGRKTQTRRALSGQWDQDATVEPPYVAPYAEGARAVRCDPQSDAVWSFAGAAGAAVGDRLWVREVWRVHRALDHVRVRDLGTTSTRWYGEKQRGEAGRARSSIHMPRWASRLTLHVTDIRVQQLQEISRDDAGAEGCPAEWRNREIGWFSDLWCSLHGEGAWDANPWVAAITFKVERANIDAAPLPSAFLGFDGGREHG